MNERVDFTDMDYVSARKSVEEKLKKEIDQKINQLNVVKTLFAETFVKEMTVARYEPNENIFVGFQFMMTKLDEMASEVEKLQMNYERIKQLSDVTQDTWVNRVKTYINNGYRPYMSTHDQKMPDVTSSDFVAPDFVPKFD